MASLFETAGYTFCGCLYSLTVVNYCVTFAPINKTFHVVRSFPRNSNNGMNIAIAC
ncbi:hypothetical protein BDV12DRAFT_179182 [Aspergillus spectabilis]